jgi:hypothetical protein
MMIGSFIGIYLIMSLISPGNIRRFKTIPESIISAITGDIKTSDRLNQDQESAQTRHLKNLGTWRLIKDHPIMGAGINPDQSLYIEKYPYVAGQVHCEILMAGRQMGLPGMAVYAAFLYLIVSRGWLMFRRFRTEWPDVSMLGWCLCVQGLLIVVGGAFAPLPWNPVTLALVAVATAAWADLRATERMQTQ